MSSRAAANERARAQRLAQEQSARAGERRRRRLWRLGAIVALAAVVVIVAALISRSGTKDTAATGSGVAGASEVAALFAGIPQDGTVIGEPTAAVTLTEFADLQCPFCAQFAEQSLATLVERYVRPGRVRLDFRALTFLGADSERAARVAAAAGRQDRLWQFVDLFYRNQGQENSGYATDAFLRKIASAVPGLDVRRVMRGRDTPAVRQQLTAAKAQAQRLAIGSTPSFAISRAGKAPRVLQVSTLTADAFTGPLDEELGRR